MATIRTLEAGTILHLNGIPVEVAEKARILTTDSDESFAGMLLANPKNFDLNIGQLDGEYSPVHGRKTPAERSAPPAEVPLTGAPEPMKQLTMLEQAVALAGANQWSDALACYRKAKADSKKTDSFLIGTGTNKQEREILKFLSKGTDDKGKAIFLAAQP